MSELKRPTLQMIADRAGVSKMTVSRVLRNHSNCGQKTRNKVEKIAKELNYRKHPLVSALMTDLRYKKEPQFYPIIALLHFGQRKQKLHPNRANMLQGVRECAGMQGYDVEEFYFEDLGMTPKGMLQIFDTRAIRGIIFEHSAQPNTLLDIDLSSYACLATKYSLAQPVLHRIETSQFSSILLAVDKLKWYGYKRFGLVVPSNSETISQFRRTGAMLYAQGAFPEADRIPVLNLKSITSPAIQSWLKKYKPEVVMSQTQEVYDILIELGYQIPDDVAYIHLGMPDREGTFAGIDPNWTEMGRIAANQIIDQLNRNELGIPKYPIVTLVQGNWVDGATLPRRQVAVSY